MKKNYSKSELEHMALVERNEFKKIVFNILSQLGDGEEPGVIYSESTDDELISMILSNMSNEKKAYEEGYKEGYERGIKEAWDLASLFAQCNNEEFEKIGVHELRDVFNVKYKYAEEAYKKIKEAEQKSIRIGDIVRFEEDTYSDGRVHEIIVTAFVEGGHIVENIKDIKKGLVMGITQTGVVYRPVSITSCKKTGKHIDIQEVLKKMFS